MSNTSVYRHAVQVQRGPRPIGIAHDKHIVCSDHTRETYVDGALVCVNNTSLYVKAEGRYVKPSHIKWQGR